MWYLIAMKYETGRWIQRLIRAESARAAKEKAGYMADLEGHCVLECEVLDKKKTCYLDNLTSNTGENHA